MSWKISVKNKKDRIPIVIINLYILITLSIYFFGPITYKNDMNFFILVYFLLFLLVINLGYFTGLYRYSKKKKNNNHKLKNNSVNKPIPILFQLVGLVIPVFMLLNAIKIAGVNLTGNIFSSMAKAYTFNQGGGRLQEGIDIPMWIYMHLAIFVYISIIDGGINFKNYSMFRKTTWVATLLSLILYFTLYKGTQKTLGDIVILLGSSLLVRMYRESAHKKINKKIIFMLIFGILSSIFAFSSILGNRIAYLNSLGYNAFSLHGNFWDVNLDSLLLALFPNNMKIGFAALTFYLCNGISGLGYCLKTPFTWSYGLATFGDVADIVERRLGIKIFENTYPFKAYELYGWEHSEHWHTIFPWLASDFTYLGALILLGFMAYIYAICWEDIIYGKNKESIYLFCILNIMWVFVPANNQLLSTRITGLVFMICLVAWLKRNKNTGGFKKLFYEK